jgi:hypothetical protein
MIVSIFVGILIALAAAGFALYYGTLVRLREANERAERWEQVAGDVARDQLAAAQYARVAMPKPPEEPDKSYAYDQTGLIRTEIPRDDR